jgi:hypothetical protein
VRPDPQSPGSEISIANGADSIVGVSGRPINTHSHEYCSDLNSDWSVLTLMGSQANSERRRPEQQLDLGVPSTLDEFGEEV